MIKTAITVSLVEEARGGPFVLWDGVEAGCEIAADLGYDAIELFAPSHETVDPVSLKALLDKHQLSLAAVGTGAGMVKHQLSLADPDITKRSAAKDFIRNMIRYGAQFGAPAIIGSMQGRWGGEVSQEQGMNWLSEALNELGPVAGDNGTFLIYEPLNRYETNMCNTMAQGVELVKALDNSDVKLLADVFHMGIEEDNPVEAIRSSKGFIGHVHFVDSNRKAAGMGHLDLKSIADALIETEYPYYVSAECFPTPDSLTAAKQTIQSYKTLFPR